jgi:hypothetical protein
MEEKSPIDFFRLFFSAQVLHLIHSETQRYTEQYLEREREHLQQHPRARAHEWRRAPLLLKDIEVFLAIVIAMGICGFPTLRYKTQYVHILHIMFVLHTFQELLEYELAVLHHQLQLSHVQPQI